MLLYVEKKAKEYPLCQQICSQFSEENIVEIQHYKNLFDKKIGDFPLEPCLILAKQENPVILDTPENYGFEGKSFFFKPAINCIFACQYCYLQGTFKNRFPVIFVNIEEIQEVIKQKIETLRQKGEKEVITFYGSNYSDLLALEPITHFHESFLPFFEQFEKVRFETRTKSCNIEVFKKLKNLTSHPYHNTEIAFSLNPQVLIQQHEKKTSSLDQRIHAVNELLELWYQVWLRFLPLLPVENYQNLYRSFLQDIKEKIDLSRIASIFVAPLLYNEDDYQKIRKKHQYPFLQGLKIQSNGLRKMDSDFYSFFDQLFAEIFPEKQIFRDYQ